MKLRSFGEARTSPVRIAFLLIFFLIFAVAFVARLLSLQIANSDYYKEQAEPKNEKLVLIETVRGEIVDRNGIKLVANTTSKNIRLSRSSLPYGRENEIILELLRFFDGLGAEISDVMPADMNAPYSYVPPQDTVGKRYLATFLRTAEISADDLVGDGLYNIALERYKIDSTIGNIATDKEIRRVIGIRYALDATDFSVTYPYTLIENADIKLISALSEKSHELPGVEVAVAHSRHYPGGSLAAHILGRTGPIYDYELDEYTAKGYSQDEIVGKNGAEYAFEKYLRGIDGYKIVEYSADGEDILGERASSSERYPLPTYAGTVTLTLDAGMQKAAEDSLKTVIDGINSSVSAGSEVASGAVVVTDCRTGAVYVSASYPTYDQNTYRENISSLQTDETFRPLLNRATQGIYPPGSTFKIATAIAALSENAVDENTLIYDSGVYEEYSDFQPHCWYYDRYGVAHGWQNVVQAIMNSCNYYFFEVGRLLGTDKLNEYAGKMGLGEKTGIETGESSGILAGPEYRASIGQPWNPGDVIASAIGQSDNLFTPMQLASFFSTVVNGGTRYRTHILKSVNEFYTGKVIFETKPEIIDTVEISDEHLELVKQGMKSVVEDGTAASVFANYPYSVGGKTGTAQRGTEKDNAIFAGFAPYDEPQIVVSVVIEAGDKSSTAATVAKAVFDYYFEHINEFAE